MRLEPQTLTSSFVLLRARRFSTLPPLPLSGHADGQGPEEWARQCWHAVEDTDKIPDSVCMAFFSARSLPHAGWHAAALALTLAASHVVEKVVEAPARDLLRAAARPASKAAVAKERVLQEKVAEVVADASANAAPAA